MHLDLAINLLEHVGVDMLDLVGEDVALRRQLADRIGGGKRAADVRMQGIDLFCGRVRSDVEDHGLQVEPVRGLDQHPTELRASKHMSAAPLRKEGGGEKRVPGRRLKYQSCENPLFCRARWVVGGGVILEGTWTAIFAY